MRTLGLGWIGVVVLALAGCGGSDASGTGAAGGSGASSSGTMATSNSSASTGGTGGGTSGTGGGGGAGGSSECFKATRLWFEDFETGDYLRWTGQDYGATWKNGFCHSNGFSMVRVQSGSRSHRSDITCVSDESHRGYGGIQFDGDTPLSAYTNQGTGIQAEHGVVNTYWSWLKAPYPFQNGKWFSFWTVNNDCGWADNVITLGLEDTSNKLTPAHILNTGGTVTFVPNAPGFPMGQWVRTTIYINYNAGMMGMMVVWQDGSKLLEATFSRSDNDICQWHWGAYASMDNDEVVLYEDDNSIWKLNAAWPNFDIEPYFGVTQPVCNPP